MSKRNPNLSARFCPACGNPTAVPKGETSPWYPLTRTQIEAVPALIQFAQAVAQAGESGPLRPATWTKAKEMARAVLKQVKHGL